MADLDYHGPLSLDEAIQYLNDHNAEDIPPRDALERMDENEPVVAKTRQQFIWLLRKSGDQYLAWVGGTNLQQ